MTRKSLAVLVAAVAVWGTVAGVAGSAVLVGNGGAVGDGAADAAQGDRTVFSSCRTITESGTYVLGADIENSSADACVRIRASDVVLDGNGHTIDGAVDVDRERVSDRFLGGQGLPRPEDGVGVAVRADRTLSNVTVTGLTLTGWRWGVVADRLREGRIAGVRVADGGFGIAAFRSPRIEVTDSAAVGNAAFGVGVFGGAGSALTNVTADRNGVVGVYQVQTRGATLSNVTARDDDLAGVLLDRTRGATVRGGSVSGSRFGVYLFESTDSEVVGATSVRNRIAGVFALNATGARVADATATDNGLAGVLLRGTVGASVTSTDASRGRYGIYLFFADDTSVTESNASNGVIGVFVRNSSDAAVVNNTVLGNSFDGVYNENSTGVRFEGNRDGAVTFDSTGNETIGEEGGYEADDAIDVNQSDGLTEAELRAYVYRAIARTEKLRGLEYTGSLSLEVVSQEELDRRNEAEPDSPATAAAWENQLWEATFAVGEDRNATRVQANESSRVAGFYNSFADRLTIVSDDDPLTVSSTTLVHEIVHALQDQHFDLTRSEMRPRTQDGSRAASGLIEGDARYVEERFEQLCGVVWNCLQVASEEPPGGEVRASRNFAIRQTILAAYSDGPNYVAQLRQQGDWAAVNDAYEAPPNSTEQILHPDRRNERPVPLTFEDDARAGWEQFDQSNLSSMSVDGTTTVGEVGIFTMFWYQGYEYDNPIVDVREHLYPNDPTFDLFNYTAPPSDGWGNDVLVPYRRGTGGTAEYGYVWLTAWDTETDARQFRRAYLDLLDGHDAERVGPNTWVVESGPFADAFRVVREGANVTIVNAPTVGGLADLRPGLAEDANATTSDAETTTTAVPDTETTSITTQDSERTTTLTSDAENATTTSVAERRRRPAGG